MGLEISPSEVQFESVELASQVELTLSNTSSNLVTYRFRLQSKAVTISQPKGTIEGGQAQAVSIKYDPKLNVHKDILLSMQLKYSEDTKSGNELTKLLPISFMAEQDMEDDMFKTPLKPRDSDSPGEPWWKK